MGTWLRTGALALTMIALGAPALAAAPDKGDKTEAVARAQVAPEMLALQKSLHTQTGDVRIPAAKAVLHLGEDYYFIPADEAKRVLTEAWRNPPDAVANVLGIVMPKGSMLYDSPWGAVITYQDIGHVSDADAAGQDYEKVLREMQSGEEADNQSRKAAGYPTLRLVGWAQAPSYDPKSHSLIWAKELANEGEQVHGLNYDVRLLGRTGVLSLNMVSDMSVLNGIRGAAASFGRSVTFEPGAAYADYDASTDKTAEYGLAGLVAGGTAVAVAQKVGLFAVIAKFGKLIFVGLFAAFAALAGLVRRMFGGKEEKDVI
jgi:uncharacterized membrane-anchored protein